MTSFYAVQTRDGLEQRVATEVENMWNPEVHAVLAPQTMRTYVIVEADERSTVENLVREIPSAQKVLPGETSFAEVKQFLSPKSDVAGLQIEDKVEITTGSFQGDHAKVTRIDPDNEKVTVELVDAAIPIPVELPGNQLRKID